MKATKVIVDLGGVIFESTGFDSPLIHWKIVSQLNEKYGHALNVGEDLFGDFLKDYNQLSQQNLSGSAFLKAIFDTLNFNQDLVSYLNAHFKEVIILSDNYRENIAYIAQRYNFASWADHQFYSFEFAKTKEDATLFTQVLAALNTSASEVIFIDDSPRKIASAQKCGIESFLFLSNQKLFTELDKRINEL